MTLRQGLVTAMNKLVAMGAVASLAVVAVIASSSATSAAASLTYKVQLSHAPATVNADGSVSVVGWLRCTPDLYTFEYSVDITQQGASGLAFLSGANLPCDGARHRFVIDVLPYQGTFQPGPADIGIYIGLYDAANDADLEARDTVSTRLR